MKTFTKVLAGILLLVAFYFVVADGMMAHFGLNQGIQYAFNFGAILILIPFCLFVIVEEKMAYEE